MRSPSVIGATCATPADAKSALLSQTASHLANLEYPQVIGRCHLYVEQEMRLRSKSLEVELALAGIAPPKVAVTAVQEQEIEDLVARHDLGGHQCGDVIAIEVKPGPELDALFNRSNAESSMPLSCRPACMTSAPCANE